jgi:phosphatidate cytidylyltransferase
MLLKRVLVVILLLPIGVAGILIGGWVYTLGIALILALAAREYVALMKIGGFQPAGVLVVGGAALLALGRGMNGFTSAPGLLSLLVLLSMTFHLVAFEGVPGPGHGGQGPGHGGQGPGHGGQGPGHGGQGPGRGGRDQASSDFAVTVGGIVYLGWIGAYFISLRDLPDGLWWVLLVLPVIWVADSAAYFIGRRFGRHKLSPRLSPKKSWEGYLGGVVCGTLAGVLMAWAWAAFASPEWISPWKGALLGFVLSSLTTLGDLGESMIKRQVGVKDSGNLLPGHGGVFDRIDSWLWCAVLGYYLAIVLL